MQENYLFVEAECAAILSSASSVRPLVPIHIIIMDILHETLKKNKTRKETKL